MLGSDERGAAAAEFAVVLPVLASLLFGLWEFGWSQHCASTVGFALEQASRSLLINPSLDEAAVQSLVQSKLTGIADPQVTVTLSRTVDASGLAMATMTASYPHTFSLPGLGRFSINYQSKVVTPLPAGA